MNPDNQDLRTLRTLILKSQREELSEAEALQLNQLIQTEAGAAEAASLIDQLCAFTDSNSLESPPIAKLLADAYRADGGDGSTDISQYDTDAVEMPRNVTTKPQERSWKRSRWLLALVASHLLIASFAWSLAKPSPISQPVADLQTKESLPHLVSMTACVWSPSSSSSPTLGQSVELGEVLDLVEGIAELRIGEGTFGEALVRIEGPASVFIHADGQLELRHGSMTAEAIGTSDGNIAVDTPMGEVSIDGQSSIGLVSDQHVDEVHVFSGQALVKHVRAALDNRNELLLSQGEAVRFSRNAEGSVRVIMSEASQSKFVSARSSGFDPLNIGQEYVRAVTESQPSIYWRFEELQGKYPYFVENQGSAPGMNAVVVGNPGWRQYGNNRVADLGTSTSSAFRALEPWPKTPLDEYSIEMWIKPLLFHHGEVLCLHDANQLADGRYQHTMMLETTAQHYFTHRLNDSPPNRFRFVHRAIGTASPISATSLFTAEEYQARVWQHVVTQKKGNLQQLWVNGQLSGERENTAPLSSDVQVLVGQVYPDSFYRRFAGQIDEVAIYDHCLTPQELRGHIKAAGRSLSNNKTNVRSKSPKAAPKKASDLL